MVTTFHPHRFARCLLLVLAAALVFCGLSARAQQDDDGLPANLSRELHPLVLWHQRQTKSLQAMSQAGRKAAVVGELGRNRHRIQTDANANLIVNVRLDGSKSADEVKKNLAALGGTVSGEYVARRADGRDGILSVHLPADQAAAAAETPGVFSVVTAHRPRRRVGAVTSQGVAALHADTVNAQYNGKGIMVGVLSDSYNVATEASVGAPVTTHAQDDVASGDLPGTNNPDGFTTPVVVLQDGSSDPNDENTDEGRAMLQIIHDMAPGATLAFCTAGETITEFASNIRSLRTNQSADCDVIVDDIGFDDEPFFSDGIVSQAVDDVVTSTTLAGRQAIYYSAAGNDGDLSYSATFTPVSDAEGRSGNIGNLQLGSVPSSLTGGGFHNFKAADVGSGDKILQKVTVSQSDAYINFQWDDPFVPNELSTGYCLLIFDANGRYLPDVSGIDDTFRIGEALQTVDLPLNQDGSDTTYQLVISRRTGGSGAAVHLRYIVEDATQVIGKYLYTGQPTLYGHSGAAQADGVAAYDVHDTKGLPEDYNSFGPVTIYLDANGNRLATPVTRQQPTIAAVDGVDTTFFGEGSLSDTDTDNDGFPNFYGTSAAAPHAAGVAALLLQAAGGHGSLSSVQMRSLLESTAAAHDLDPGFSAASFTSPDGSIKVSLAASGDDSNNSAFSQKFFTLTFTGPAGSSLNKAGIDLSPAGEDFDESIDNGYPFTIGEADGVTTTGVTATLSGTEKLVLDFPAGAFPSGGIFAFGIDRDVASVGSGGNSADLLAGATIKTHFILADGSKVKFTGTLKNNSGSGYSANVGYGLINAQAALDKLLGK